MNSGNRSERQEPDINYAAMATEVYSQDESVLSWTKLLMAVNGREAEAWKIRAACLGIGNADFFDTPLATKKNRVPQKYCRNCLVQDDCRDYALSFGHQIHGLWGGEADLDSMRPKQRPSPEERQRLLEEALKLAEEEPNLSNPGISRQLGMSASWLGQLIKKSPELAAQFNRARRSDSS